MATTRITGMPAAATLDGSELVEVSQLSDTVTISAATISAAAADNSYNDSGAGFVAAGFAVGDRVNVAGFTGNVANNILVGAVTALTTGKMTIGGTDGDVIVDDAAGETVVISKWVSRRATLTDVAALAAGAAAAYRVGFFFTTAPSASEVLLLHTFPDGVDFLDDFADAVADVGTNPAATFDLDVQKNGSSIGTISIATGGTVTFTTTGGAVSFAAGDQLKIVGPASPGTAANVSVTLKGTLS